MSIVSLPLTNQLTNGGTADGGQVLADLNAIASQVNANAAKNGVNSDITSLTALVSIPSNVTATGWTLANALINGATIDSTTTGVTQASGDNSTKLVTTAFFQTNVPASVSSAYAPLASPALTGVPTAPTAANGTSNQQIATTQFVSTFAFNTSLPSQSASTVGMGVRSDGTNASWQPYVGNVLYSYTNLGGF